jgi:antirestriction protein ArdC
VFAAEQVDGAGEIAAEREAKRDTPERFDAADAYFHGYEVEWHEGGNRAFYNRSADEIRVPAFEQFDNAANFYGTLAHECVHSTGHESRLSREFGKRFGDEAYAAEELVAELGAAMWSGQAGVSATTREDHAAYLASWLRVLRADPKALLTVASKAQAAVDYMNTHTACPLSG